MAHPPQPQPHQGTDETAHGGLATQLIDLVQALFPVVFPDLDDQDIFQVRENHVLSRAAEERRCQCRMTFGGAEQPGRNIQQDTAVAINFGDLGRGNANGFVPGDDQVLLVAKVRVEGGARDPCTVQ
ncbi:hypothetical protein D3C86_1497630 [compost metagenome]